MFQRWQDVWAQVWINLVEDLSHLEEEKTERNWMKVFQRWQDGLAQVWINLVEDLSMENWGNEPRLTAFVFSQESYTKEGKGSKVLLNNKQYDWEGVFHWGNLPSDLNVTGWSCYLRLQDGLAPVQGNLVLRQRSDQGGRNNDPSGKCWGFSHEGNTMFDVQQEGLVVAMSVINDTVSWPQKLGLLVIWAQVENCVAESEKWYCKLWSRGRCSEWCVLDHQSLYEWLAMKEWTVSWLTPIGGTKMRQRF